MAITESPPKTRIRAARMLIEKGARHYDRSRHLDRLLGPHAAFTGGAAPDSAATLSMLKRALRSQRQLGRAGHWSYDLNRHFGLLQALKVELARARAHAMAAAGAKNGRPSTALGISETGTATS